MIEIVVSACYLVSPYNCKEVRMNFEAASVSQPECFLYGQFELAKWVGANPGWRISNWRCGVAGQFAKI